MKLNLIKTAITVFCGILLMIDMKYALAANLTMNVNGAAKSSCAYTSYSSDSSGNITVNCSSTEGINIPQERVPQCSLASLLSPIIKGSTTDLVASCSPEATSYTWTNTGVATTNSPNVSVSPPITTTYTVVGTNATGSGNAATFTLPVIEPVATVPSSCRIVDITWPTGGLNLETTPLQHLPRGQMVAFRTKVPEGRPLVRSGTAYADVPKYMSISTNPCDFSESLKLSRCMAGGRNNPIIWNTTQNDPGYCQLPPAATTIYFNFKNSTTPTGPDTCIPGANCKFYFYW